VHGWVPDPRRQDVERRSVHSSVHDHDYDHDDYNHDNAPPRVVKTVIRDSDNTVAGLDEDQLRRVVLDDEGEA
jgi:hypothetical protein